MESNQVNPRASMQVNASYGDEFDLKELFWVLWDDKWFVVGVSAFFAVTSVIFALMLTNVYRAEAVLVAASSGQSPGGLTAQLGGAAAMLGVDLGGGSGDSTRTALATMRSRQFLVKFVEDKDLLPSLFASTWDSNLNQSLINDEIYDPSTGNWLLEDGRPTEHDAYRAFSSLLSINGPSRDSGIVTVAIDWINPLEAAQWVNMLIDDLNQEVRARDIQEATNAIEYLQQQLVGTQLVDMQRVFYQLIESQTRITMLADVRDEYVFRVIDPAVVPDQKIAPSRAFICIVGTLVGALLGCLIVIARRLLLKK